MHVNVYDHYQPRSSWVHLLDPRVKVVVTLLCVLSVTLLPDGAWLTFALSWALVLALTLAAYISPWLVVRRAFVALPFLLAATTVLFMVPGDVVWQGPWGLTVSGAGLERFASIVIRGWIAVQMAILLAATTRLPDILHALRHLKAPAVLVSILAFMYRYLFVLADEAARLLRARAARSARLPGHKAGGALPWRARVAGNMVGQLFVRSLSRSDRVHQAMLARGYRGELLTMNPHKMRAFDWAALILACLLLFALQVVARA
jgi:cobalt/nickel transport system permease protein